ncbi:MAG: Mut7-C RNAse domain-containing protein [Dehalococcoidia bacterium]
MSEPRFLVDINVGHLTKWLRAMGYDAICLPHASDNELISRALGDGRALLTRDNEIARRKVAASGRLRVLLLKEQEVTDQLRQVVGELGLEDDGRAFTRCLECNEGLRDRSKATVEGVVPPYVFQTREAFKDCPACGRVYWQGTHWARMRRVLDGVRGGLEGAPR